MMSSATSSNIYVRTETIIDSIILHNDYQYHMISGKSLCMGKYKYVMVEKSVLPLAIGRTSLPLPEKKT